MRRRRSLAAFTVLGAIVVACADELANGPADPAPVNGPSVDASTRPDSSGGAITDTSTPPVDSSTLDAPADAPADASQDAGHDGAIADAAGNDAASDADAAGPIDFALTGIATATSEYGPDYAAAKVNDGDLGTSWYAATGSCDADPDAAADFVCSGAPTSIEVALSATHTIGRVKLFGNRDSFPTSYDVLTARIELVGATGTVHAQADVTTTRGAEPNGDAEQVFSPAVTNVKTIRVVVLTGLNSGPGLGAIEAYRN